MLLVPFSIPCTLEFISWTACPLLLLQRLPRKSKLLFATSIELHHVFTTVVYSEIESCNLPQE